ncbi:CAP domain-containing protein [Hyaloraphidium curvatum]|nr:CAP domain-containing protein [Hyaloraphidium curvatum]
MHTLPLLLALLLILPAARGDQLCLTNLERQKAGLRPLRADAKLAQAALAHSQDQDRGNFMSHTGSDGSNLRDRVERAGFTGWRAIGENVASGQRTEEQVMQDWMNSPGHRANILGEQFTLFGSGRSGNSWTQVFGATFNDDPSPPPVCPDGSSAPAATTVATAPTTTATPRPSGASASGSSHLATASALLASLICAFIYRL